jgi:hypothetical protein
MNATQFPHLASGIVNATSRIGGGAFVPIPGPSPLRSHSEVQWREVIDEAPEIWISEVEGKEELERSSSRRSKHATKAPGTGKQGLAVQIEIENFIRIYGLSHCALLTLLLSQPNGQNPLTYDEAQRIFKNATRRLIPSLFETWIAVLDFHREGAIHFHLLVACRFNIRQGWNWTADEAHRTIKEAGKKRRLTGEEILQSRELCRNMSSNPELKSVWKLLRDSLPKLGFPKSYPCELKPVRNPAGLGVYLAGRYRESRGRPDLRKRGSRCVRYSPSYQRCVDKKFRFSPVGPGASRYRRKKAKVGAAFGIHDIGDMIKTFGKSWEYDFRKILQNVNPRDENGFFSDQYKLLAEKVQAYQLDLASCQSQPIHSITEDLIRSQQWQATRRAALQPVAVPAPGIPTY